MEQTARTLSPRQQWSEARPTKTLVFWGLMGTVALTMIVGFTWGGWVTGGTALRMAEASGEEAILKRLGPICITQSKQDPKLAAKLKELGGMDSWQRGEFVKKQGWATMPGEQEADSKVAEACVRLLP